MLTYKQGATGMLPTNKFLEMVGLDLLAASYENQIDIVGKKIKYYNIPAAFDIETSSFYIGDTKYACMYHWQFGIGSYVTHGRTWESFTELMDEVAEIFNTGSLGQAKLIVYVHNLPYEFQWIRKRFEWEKIFVMDDRKPIYARTKSGIEFRCSLKLSGKSLANTAKDLTKFSVAKLTGDLDYNLIRHSNTPLTDEELKYCENDIRVLLAYIQEKIWSDGDISKIPLTKTGYVRKYCRDACFPEVAKDDRFDEALDVDPSGVSRDERLFSRGFYPRERAQDRQSLEESGVIRFYEFIHRYYGGRKIPYEQRRIYRRGVSGDDS